MADRDSIKPAVDYIEANLKTDIKIADCAGAVGYSEYHFIRLFKQLTGLTPADYIRKRRLTEIVKQVNTGLAFADVIFEYGFNSKENFTRAFVAEHHILPTEYKTALNSLKLYEPLRVSACDIAVVPELVQLEPFVLVVYKSDEGYAPNFWNKYNGRGWSKGLSGGAVCEDYGVCSWNAEARRLDYYIGIRKADAKGDLCGTVELTIPSGLYAKFITPPTTHYDFINTIHRTWGYIHSQWLPQSGYRKTGGVEFECYVEPSRTYSETIYIPLEPANKKSIGN